MDVRNKETGQIMELRDWVQERWRMSFYLDDQIKADWIRWELKDIADKHGIYLPH